jgi:hypothetical protein
VLHPPVAHLRRGQQRTSLGLFFASVGTGESGAVLLHFPVALPRQSRQLCPRACFRVYVSLRTRPASQSVDDHLKHPHTWLAVAHMSLHARAGVSVDARLRARGTWRARLAEYSLRFLLDAVRSHRPPDRHMPASPPGRPPRRQDLRRHRATQSPKWWPGWSYD